MKYVVTLALLLSVQEIVFSQQYYVLHHTGVIKQKNNIVVKDGTNIPAAEPLTYDSKDDKLFVFIPHKGNCQLNLSARAKQEGNVWVEAMLGSVQLKLTKGNMFGQSGTAVLAYDLHPDSRYSSYLLLQTINPYLFNQNAYPASGIFYLQITEPGKESQKIDLSTDKDTLFLKAEYFANHPDSTHYILAYDGGTHAKALADIHPVLDTTGKMDRLTALMIGKLKSPGLPRDSLMNQCYFTVYQVLGMPCMVSFQRSFSKIYAKLNTARP
ncbi:MAG TPA: hypothetical protein VF974_07755 [Patescibacteria group bacterium]